MTENKKPTQREIDNAAESVLVTAVSEKQRLAKIQAEKLAITAGFTRSKLAIQ